MLETTTARFGRILIKLRQFVSKYVGTFQQSADVVPTVGETNMLLPVVSEFGDCFLIFIMTFAVYGREREVIVVVSYVVRLLESKSVCHESYFTIDTDLCTF